MSRTHKSISAIFNLQQSHVPLLAIVLSTPGLGGNGYPEVISAFSLIVTGAQRRAKGHILHFASRLAPQAICNIDRLFQATCQMLLVGDSVRRKSRGCATPRVVVTSDATNRAARPVPPSYCG